MYPHRSLYSPFTNCKHLVTCLATMAFVYTACTVCVTIFSTGSKFRPVSNFTELQLLLQLPVLTRSCILTSPLMQVCGPVRLVSCPDPPTQLTRGEGVWCHKSKSLGKLWKTFPFSLRKFVCTYVWGLLQLWKKRPVTLGKVAKELFSGEAF